MRRQRPRCGLGLAGGGAIVNPTLVLRRPVPSARAIVAVDVWHRKAARPRIHDFVDDHHSLRPKPGVQFRRDGSGDGFVADSGRRFASQEASGSSIDFTSDFGATLRQARMRAVSTMASLACASTTSVAPRRPQPPGTGTKALGAACMSMACCSGVSWIVATEDVGHSKLANDFRPTRKSERPLRKLSTAPG